jgi:hypothetical protein
VKQPTMFLHMLLVIGMVLSAGCDIEKENLVEKTYMNKMLFNSQFYLIFDADYNNDSVVDEHVEMYANRYFNYIGEGLERYQSEFRGKNCLVWIDLPKNTNSPITYTNDDLWDFNLTYLIFNDVLDDYSTEPDHDFTFTITEWGKPSNILKANFYGYLVNDWVIPPAIIQISNGELYTRISDYYGD